MSGDACRLHRGPLRVSGAEQGAVGHHQVHLDRLLLADIPAGEQAKGPVGGDGSHGAALRQLVGTLTRHHGGSVAANARVGADDLDERPQHREVAHAVRRRTHRHAPRPHRLLHPTNHGSGIELGCHPAGRSLRTADAEAVEHRPHPPVDLGAVLQGQHARRLHHDQGVLLRAVTGVERPHRARHLIDQGASKTDEEVTESGGLATSKGYLRPDRPHGILRRCRLTGLAQRAGGSSLGGGSGGLHAFQLRHEVDAFAVGEVLDIEAREPLPQGADLSGDVGAQMVEGGDRRELCHDVIVRRFDGSRRGHPLLVEKSASEAGLWMAPAVKPKPKPKAQSPKPKAQAQAQAVGGIRAEAGERAWGRG